MTVRLDKFINNVIEFRTVHTFCNSLNDSKYVMKALATVGNLFSNTNKMSSQSIYLIDHPWNLGSGYGSPCFPQKYLNINFGNFNQGDYKIQFWIV